MKKLMLGLMMAFAVTAEAAVTIDGFKYELDAENKTATLTGYMGSPTKVDVSEVEYEGQKYTVTTIGYQAFFSCSSLTSVSLPNATTIGASAFQDCSKLTTVSLLNATTIDEYAFSFCSSLTEISLPNATTIGDRAFLNSSLTSVFLPNVTTIGASAFFTCSSLTSVSLPNATTIGESAFYECPLASVSLPNATMIGASAFQNCPNLTTVSLLSVVSIGKYAFGWCGALSTLIVSGTMKSVIETNGRSEYGLSDSVQIIPAKGDLKFVPEESVIVSKESIAAPSAGTVKVEDNKVQLGVTVLKTSDLTAEKKDWGEVTLTADDVKVVDGKIVISVPVDSASGFMVIQTKDAAK